MKKMMLILAGTVIAVSLAACSPTDVSTQTAAEDGEEGMTVEASIEETEREVVEKLPDADAAPMAQVSVFTIKEDKTGLSQNMDAVDSEDGETVDAQLLIDKMIEYGVLEEGTEVLNFSQDGTAVTVDLSAMPNQDDVLEQTAVANTLIQNYEADTLNLTVNGEAVGDGSFEFNKSYKNMSESADSEGSGSDESKADGVKAEETGETEAEARAE